MPTGQHPGQSYIVTLSKGTGQLQSGTARVSQRLRGRSHRAIYHVAELIAAALAMKEVLFCVDIMIKLGFGQEERSVLIYIDSTATLHVAGNRTHSGRTKHVALRYFLVRELSKPKIYFHYASTANRIAETATK